MSEEIQQQCPETLNQTEKLDENAQEKPEEHPIEQNTTDNNKNNSISKPHEFRTCLPSCMVDRSKYSIWSILKQCVDKELYRFTLPIVWNEPVSLLQRFAENMKYSNELLDKAADISNPIERMKKVAAFLVSTTSIHIERLSKPFNPLLGETFEYVCSKNNYRICSEQVSHHPPISAYHAESILPTKSSSKWRYYGSIYPQMKLNILNAAVEAIPEGIHTLEFPELDEAYTWFDLKINLHNLILGKLWFEFTGKIEIVNHKLNIKSVLDFKPYSWFTRQQSRCEGYILDSNDNKLALFYGRWDKCLFCTNDVNNLKDFQKKVEKILSDENLDNVLVFEDYKKLQGIELLWKYDFSDKPQEQYHGFTNLTFKLNEIYNDLLNETKINLKSNSDDETQMTREVTIGPLPKTDARFRPDMRLYEAGDVDISSNEKHRLEEKQREKRRKVEAGELPEWKPLWFDKKNHPIRTDYETWCFNEKYWNRDFTQCDDIY